MLRGREMYRWVWCIPANQQTVRYMDLIFYFPVIPEQLSQVTAAHSHDSVWWPVLNDSSKLNWMFWCAPTSHSDYGRSLEHQGLKEAQEFLFTLHRSTLKRELFFKETHQGHTTTSILKLENSDPSKCLWTLLFSWGNSISQWLSGRYQHLTVDLHINASVWQLWTSVSLPR